MKNHNADTFNFRSTYDKHGNAIKLTAAATLALGSVGIATNVFQSDPKFDGDSRANIILENKLKSDAFLNTERTKNQLFYEQLTKAVQEGPRSIKDIIGTYAVGQDRTIGNAIIQESGKAGYPLDIENDHQDLVEVTVSSNEFGSSYGPDNLFQLYKSDVDGDGEDEILAKSVE
jgi:hypothetical protein